MYILKINFKNKISMILEFNNMSIYFTVKVKVNNKYLDSLVFFMLPVDQREKTNIVSTLFVFYLLKRTLHPLVLSPAQGTK